MLGILAGGGMGLGGWDWGDGTGPVLEAVGAQSFGFRLLGGGWG